MKHRRRLVLPALVILLLAVLLAGLSPGPAMAVHDDALELDGNTAHSPAGIPDDWDNVYLGTSSAFLTLFAPDSAEPDYSTFALGSKDGQGATGTTTTPGGPWFCNRDNNPQQKTNIFNAYAAMYRVDGDLRLYMGADREDDEGTAFIGFWLFQDDVDCIVPVGSTPGDHKPFSGKKRHGDLLFIADFATGDTVPIGYKAYMWTDPTPASPESGDECLGNGTVCGEASPFLTGGVCQTDPHANPNFCGATNTADIDAEWRMGIQPTQFVEMGINLSQVAGVAGRCYRTFMAEGRSSVELTADLKDFVRRGLDTCGQITIVKETVGGNATFQFDVTQGTLSPDPFALDGGQSQAFTGVAPGSYAITELLDQLPAGWLLGDVQCTATGTGTSASGDPLTGIAAIVLEAGGSVTCTFTNTQLAANTPDVRVTKDDSPDPVGAGLTLTYTLLVENLTGVAASNVTATDTLPAGTSFVSCVAPLAVSCTHSLGTVTADLGTIAGNDSRTITITVTAPTVASGLCPGTLVNTATVSATDDSNPSNDTDTEETQCVAATATITVDKVTVPAGDPTAFQFSITRPDATVVDGFALADQDPGHDTAVGAPGSYIVTESPVAGWLTSAVCTGGPFGAGAPYTGAAFAVNPGDHVVCTFTNLRLSPGGEDFCSACKIDGIISPNSPRFKNNAGLDHIVRTDLGESIQQALDLVNDVNGDGYVLIGVVSNGTGAYGGHTTQRIEINRLYPGPFGLIGCGVTLHDPDAADGLPTARITAGAGNPLPAAGSRNIVVTDLHAADSLAGGWIVAGNGREIRNANAVDNAVGVTITGNNNAWRNGVVERNGSGFLVSGTGNILDTVKVLSNATDGIAVTGAQNLVSKGLVGDAGKGNGRDGISLAGTSNVVNGTGIYANVRHGVAMTGASHHVIKTTVGAKGKGNGGTGILAAGTGVLLQDNKVSANAGAGVDVSGGTAAAPNRLRGNLSNTGKAGSATENAGPEFRLLGTIYNNGGGNKADNILVPKTTPNPKCSGFPATNATVPVGAVFLCE